jgi:hypothetical protein
MFEHAVDNMMHTEVAKVSSLSQGISTGSILDSELAIDGMRAKASESPLAKHGHLNGKCYQLRACNWCYARRSFRILLIVCRYLQWQLFQKAVSISRICTQRLARHDLPDVSIPLETHLDCESATDSMRTVIGEITTIL